jgi:hypothetical protein
LPSIRAATVVSRRDRDTGRFSPVLISMKQPVP